MKNGLVIFLIPLFLLSTAGVSIMSLYCQGELCEVGFTVHPCCDDVNKGGCCKTESNFLKITDSFVKQHVDIIVKTFCFDRAIFIVRQFSFQKLTLQLPIKLATENDWPPGQKTQNTYLYLRTFII